MMIFFFLIRLTMYMYICHYVSSKVKTNYVFMVAKTNF